MRSRTLAAAHAWEACAGYELAAGIPPPRPARVRAEERVRRGTFPGTRGLILIKPSLSPAEWALPASTCRHMGAAAFAGF